MTTAENTTERLAEDIAFERSEQNRDDDPFLDWPLGHGFEKETRMIPSMKPMKITEYLPIDHCSEGYGYVKPKDGEEFLGIPFGWHGENSPAFIEIRKNGKVTATVNTSDVSEIHFEEQP
jgi:hypothetical protein